MTGENGRLGIGKQELAMIFLSYREQDTNTFVELLEQHLKRVFPNYVFRDKKRLEGSQDFQQDLNDALAQSDIVLVVVGEQWQQCCFKPPHPKAYVPKLMLDGDWVRHEITGALKDSSKTVLPVVHNMAELPSREWLECCGLGKLRMKQIVRVRDDQFNELHVSDFKKLCQTIVDKTPRYRPAFDLWLKTGDGPQQRNSESNRGPDAATHVDRYLTALVQETKDLKLPSLGTHPRISLPIERAYFPLEAAYVGRVVAEPLDRNREFQAGLDGQVALDKVFATAKGHEGVVILGEPGAGKTTLARRFAWELASRDLGNFVAFDSQVGLGLPAGLRPVFLRLRALTDAMLAADSPLEELLAVETFRVATGQDPEGHNSRQYSESLLESGSLLWILDGLDEVFEPGRREKVSTALQNLAAKGIKSDARRGDRYLVTSRFQGYYEPGVQLGRPFFDFRILPLPLEKSAEFIRVWFPAAYSQLPRIESTETHARDKASKLITKLKEREHRQRNAGGEATSYQPGRGLFDLICNPLLLTIVCMVYDQREDLPENRAKLYDQALELMLKDWRKDLVPFDPEAAKAVLGRLAWWLHQEKNRLVGPIAELREQACTALADVNPDARLGTDGVQFLEWMRNPIGLLAYGLGGESQLGFLHRCFQEHLAALHAVKSHLAADLADRAHEDWWFEVVLLALREHGKFPEEFFRQMLERRLHVTEPLAASHYVNEAIQLPTRVFGQYLRKQSNPGVIATGLRWAKRLVGLKTGRDADQVKDAAAITSALNLIQNRAPVISNLQPVLASLAASRDERVSARAKAVLGLVAANPQPSTTGPSVVLPKSVAPVGAPKRLWHPSGTQSEFVWVAPGRFEMGDQESRRKHPVEVTRGFWLGTTPITNGQYRVYLEEQAGRVPTPVFWDDRRWIQENQPVVGVSWLNAMAYCDWATTQVGMRCCLPTEAQWEFACRAGKQSAYCFGDSEAELRNYAWYEANSRGTTAPVKTKSPNAWGLYDMHGNVWEWCYDLFRDDAYEGREAGVTNPVVADAAQDQSASALRGLRGGSWGHPAAYCRSAIRYGYRADHVVWSIGFRVAVHPGPVVPSQMPAGSGRAG
jgi:formylglycine-generating enzyme required for sulfatase activity